jgi:atypical dual specificity phosphatase
VIKTESDLTFVKKTFNLLSEFEISDSKTNNTDKNILEQNTIQYDNIIKFPRTKHIVNLGAMTRDDLMYTLTEQKDLLSNELIIEEKIDGANLGIFLNKETMKIMVQNRSHFVNCEYHEQFKLLEKWITLHSSELFEILQENEYILYGEWVYFKHSIHYTKIPDYFILFDIYDRVTKQFLSREKVNSIIKNTTLQQVPIIANGKFTLDELKKIATTKSIFYDGPVEGIYVRAIKDGITKLRGKIVRSNFISGNEHWTKNKYITNILNNSNHTN